MKSKIRIFFVRRLHRAATGIFTMSEWAANGIARDFDLPREHLHVSLPGANLHRWRFVDRTQRSGSDPIRILMVGGEFRRKGGELLLHWAETTKATHWQLDIVTWPDQLPDWVKACLGHPSPDGRFSASLAPRLPNVRVHCGLKSNEQETCLLFENADIFCLPTLADGSSIASLEAMASGLPVLVGAVGGIPELIEDGKTGMLLKPGDSEDLSAKLDVLILDGALRRSLSCAARASCETYYNVERQLREILAVIDADVRRTARIERQQV